MKKSLKKLMKKIPLKKKKMRILRVTLMLFRLMKKWKRRIKIKNNHLLMRMNFLMKLKGNRRRSNLLLIYQLSLKGWLFLKFHLLSFRIKYCLIYLLNLVKNRLPNIKYRKNKGKKNWNNNNLITMVMKQNHQMSKLYLISQKILFLCNQNRSLKFYLWQNLPSVLQNHLKLK